VTIDNASRPPRPSPVRRRRGDDTRRKVEEAAGRLFSERGYEAATMQAIADEAGVHVQTIYLAYGTKAAVLAAAAARLVAGEDDPDTHPSERGWARAIRATADPAAKIRLYVHHIREIAPRVVRLIDTLRATAADQLRPELDLDAAADLAYAVASPDTFRALVEDRGWTLERAEAWVGDELCRILLPEPEPPAGPAHCGS
jgi:AcrR family transcriptional regulator